MADDTTYEGELDGAGLFLAIVVSRFNDSITGKLLAGARRRFNATA